MKYECDYIENMELLSLYINCIQSKQKIALTLMLTSMFYWIAETMEVSDEVWMWVHWKLVTSPIVQRFVLSWNKKLHLRCYFQQCLIKSTKQCMWVMKYEGECIKTMEYQNIAKHYRGLHCFSPWRPQSPTLLSNTLLLITKEPPIKDFVCSYPPKPLQWCDFFHSSLYDVWPLPLFDTL